MRSRKKQAKLSRKKEKLEGNAPGESEKPKEGRGTEVPSAAGGQEERGREGGRERERERDLNAVQLCAVESSHSVTEGQREERLSRGGSQQGRRRRRRRKAFTLLSSLFSPSVSLTGFG